MLLFVLVLISLLLNHQELQVLNEMEAVKDDHADAFVRLEEIGQAPDCEIELGGIHTVENIEVGEHSPDECMLVVCYGLYLGFFTFPTSFWSGTINELVLLVEVTDLLHKLVHTEAALDVDQNCAQFLALINLLRLFTTSPFLWQSCRQYELVNKFALSIIVVVIDIDELVLLESTLSIE